MGHLAPPLSAATCISTVLYHFEQLCSLNLNYLVSSLLRKAQLVRKKVTMAFANMHPHKFHINPVLPFSNFPYNLYFSFAVSLIVTLSQYHIFQKVYMMGIWGKQLRGWTL